MFLRQTGTTLAMNHRHSGIPTFPQCKLNGITKVCHAPRVQYVRHTLSDIALTCLSSVSVSKVQHNEMISSAIFDSHQY